MKLSVIFVVIAMFFVGISCQSDQQKVQKVDESGSGPTAVLEEVIQGDSYTYVRFKKDNADAWAAVSKTDAKVGDTFYYLGEMEMKNFHSKGLDRTFESIYFIDKFSETPIAGNNVQATDPHGNTASGMVSGTQQGTTAAGEKKEITIEAEEGVTTIAELYKNKQDFLGKTVKLKGEVTKFSSMIMGRNFVHIQDGTDSEGSFDMTITTTDEVAKGDVVVFEGKVTLDKDFGAGYFYDVIVEEAKLQ